MANYGSGGMGLQNQLGSPMQIRQDMQGNIAQRSMMGSKGGNMQVGSPGSVGGMAQHRPAPGPGPVHNQNPKGSSQMSSQASSQQLQFDSVAQVRALVGSLRKSLSKVVQVAATNICYAAAIDNGLQAPLEASPQRLDKALEEFFSLCNQIESNLRLILECTMQGRRSLHYLPIPVDLQRQDPCGPRDNAMSYSQLVATIGSQLAYAKEVQEILASSAGRLLETQQLP